MADLPGDNDKRESGGIHRDATDQAPVRHPIILSESGDPYPETTRPGAKIIELLKGVGSEKILNIVLTAIIAFSAITQTVVSCKNNATTATQTEKLIRAAQMSAHSAAHNAAAATSFSQSADSINGGIENAVKKLTLQANQAGRSAQAAEDAVGINQTQMRLDQRAWIGFQDIKIERTTAVGDGGASNPENLSVYTKKAILDIKGVHLSLVNFGKTPGTIENLEGTMAMGGQSQIVEGLNPNVLDSSIGIMVPSPPKILIPQQSSKLEFGGARMERTIAMQPLAIVSVRVDYLDIWKEKHTTKLCFYISWRMGEAFNYCPDPGSNTED
jgi:uncharacterized protein YecT (DUF1311 family)